ncbi:SGNH/GDSL hydrolase family protein [Cellulomonas aerilata]|uniref:SGNH hydrolase-type esterase domain-containing protein n=1 Tax=Cellulomonas aerilata TaxID=515326 RepID=A0A512D808_9CELL|nr:GDSL-type esterase/lipase family protein [Cellulomonas aerilata]GEO32591.1 hypothetical protein CAE01nite_03160 [Cellulomonas aerilata]
MIEENIDLPAPRDPAPPADPGGTGNGAPLWLDDAAAARYTHHSRLPLHAMVGLDPELADVLDAHFIGCTPDRLREIRQQHAETLARTADALLAEPGFAARLARVPAVTGPRVVVLGDSITADSLGWADLLAAGLRRLPGSPSVTVTNLSVSGSTSAETIAMFDLVVRRRPTCVLAMIGTNDGRRQGAAADVRTVSPTETERNLRALRTLTEADAGSRFVAIAPPPMDQDRFDATAPDGATVRFTVDDLDATLTAVRAAAPDVVDVPALLGSTITDDFWVPDGVHPSLTGQTVLVRHIVDALSRLAPAG